MQTQADTASLLPPLRMKHPVGCVYGVPYGVRGLCRNWPEGQPAVQQRRATMVVNTWFKEFTL
jgi:hypothetical protein